MTEDDVAAVFDRLPGWVNADAGLVRRGRFFSGAVLIGYGGGASLMTVREGALGEVLRGPPLMRSWAFAVRAAPEAWERFWQPVPAPGFNDLLAMTRFGTAAIEGDLHPLMANLRYFKEVLAAPRGIAIAAEARHAG